MHVPFVDLARQSKIHKQEYLKAIESILDKANYILGKEVEEDFENSFKSFTGSKYAIGVANGTDALHLALRAIKIIGDEVIVPVMIRCNCFGSYIYWS